MISDDFYVKYGDYSEDIFSDLYDYLPLYAERGDVEFYLNCANKYGGDLLELGCGTGRVAIPLAYLDLNIIGLDYSMPMLKKLKRKLQGEPDSISERIMLIRGDMTDFRFNRKFDLIIMPFRPFQHLISTDDQVNCLNRVREHLSPNGVFIFDMFNPTPAVLFTSTFGPITDVPRFEMADGRKLTRISRIKKAHWKEKWNEYEFIYIIEESDGKREEIIQQTSMRYFSPEEMELIVDMSGLKIKEFYGDFDSSPFEEESPEEIYILEAK